MKKIIIFFVFVSLTVLNANDDNLSSKSDYYYDMASKKGQVFAQSFFETLGYLGKGIEDDFLTFKNHVDNATKKTNDNMNAFLTSAQKSFNDVNFTVVKSYIIKDANGTRIFAKDELDDLLYSFSDNNYLQAQAKEGNTTAAFELGNFYYFNLKQDNFVKARQYYELSSTSKDDEIKAASLYKLGNIYFYGKAVIINYEKALEFYELSAKLNYPKAQAKLALMYFNGIEVDKNTSRAKELLQKACQGGFAKACTFYNENFVQKHEYNLEF